jgi:hypothetical protein
MRRPAAFPAAMFRTNPAQRAIGLPSSAGLSIFGKG